jgi:hypothetical protein
MGAGATMEFNRKRFFLRRASDLEVKATKISHPQHLLVAGRVDIGTVAPQA